MKERNIRLSERLLLIGYGIILFFMIIQDWIPIGSLNDVEAILETNSFQYVLTTTIINVSQILFYWYWCSAKGRTIPTDVWRHTRFLTSNEWYRSEYVSYHLSRYSIHLYRSNLLYNAN